MIRRDFHRYEVNEFCHVKGEAVFLRNISSRGCRIISHFPLEIGEKVVIVFDIPVLFEHRTVKEARVSWCRSQKDGEWECGLDFGIDNRLPLTQ